MKKLSILLVSVFLFVHTNAQNFSTNTGNVKFLSKTKMETIESRNNQITMILNSKGNVQIVVPINSFEFEKELMSTHFREDYLETSKFPNAIFKGAIVNMKGVNLNKPGTYKVQVKGNFNLHGVFKSETINGVTTVTKDVIKVAADFNVKCSDYGITIPAAVVPKVNNEINVVLNADLKASIN